MNTPLDLITAKFVNALEAERARAELEPYSKQIPDLAIVTKDKNGNIFIDDRDDLEGGEGAKLGALVGSIFGIAFGPGGLLGTAIAVGLGIVGGAIAGKIAAEKIDTGIDDNALKALVDSLDPTSSGMVLIVEETVADEIFEILEAPQAEFRRYDLTLSFPEKKSKLELADETKKKVDDYNLLEEQELKNKRSDHKG